MTSNQAPAQNIPDTVKMWREVFSLSYGNNWVRIPDRLVKGLGLPHENHKHGALGICGGTICTQKSALHANRFLDRMNNIGKDK